KKCKVFPGDDSVWKVIYLAIKDVSKKWSMPIQHWRLAMSRFIENTKALERTRVKELGKMVP
ncbi:hypothetical protein ONJ16_26675, partial [Salmonella enterica subsp. enterica serovar Montevideo]|nr:hypothetical protein [Salmonella enterica subsp. enterica serovar Montevideo]